MILTWLTYCLLVSLLLGAAAWVAEEALRAQGWPGRWPWAAAMAGSIGLPLAAWLRPAMSSEAPTGSMLPMPGAYVMESIPALSLQSASTTGPSLEMVVLLTWAAATAGLLVYLVVSALRVRAEGRRWRRGEVDGVEVMVSEATGPAALGLFHGLVVLPEWALRLDARLRSLLVLHESEHVRARDPQLAVAGLVTCALMPWNVALWWQLTRLRLAIEMDCDARVLRRSGDMSSYGSLLLEVGQRRARLAVGLAETRSMLERRLRMITKTTRGRRTVRALGLGVVSALVLAVACETPPPTGVADAPSQPLGTDDQRPAAVEADRDVAAGPTFTPMTVRPQLQNAGQVQAALQRHYPPLLRDAGIGGTTSVWFFIDEDGAVRDTRIQRSSGHDALDQAALAVAHIMEFSPAYNRDVRVPVWVALDIRFETGDEDGDIAQGPPFTPMTERPRLLNTREVQEELQRHYPPLLRNAGIGGTTKVWFFIDRTGEVQDLRLNQTSGYDALDQAALRVARAMEFSPGRNRGEVVPVWVSIPITFEIP